METIRSPFREELTLKRFLRLQYPLLSERILTRALAQRDVRRAEKRLYGNSVVRYGDELCVYIDGKYLHPALPVAYEDADMLALVKPRGIPSVGEGSLESAVQREYPEAQACHRLDTKTGGLILFSRSEAAHERLLEAFRERRIRKEYRCTVIGKPSPDVVTLRAYLRKDAAAGRVEVFDVQVRDSLPIETGYRVLRSDGALSELAVELITGRTHQIRAQMAHIGHPVLGDDRYGDREANRRFGARSMRLWAAALTLGNIHIVSAPPWEEEANGSPDDG